MDYLTRIVTGSCPEEVFTVARGGASLLVEESYGSDGELIFGCLTQAYLRSYEKNAPMDLEEFKTKFHKIVKSIPNETFHELVQLAGNFARLLVSVKGLDDTSIVSTVKISSLDACFRAGVERYKPMEEINPDMATIENIRVMVERSVHFLDLYGPKTLDGFTLAGGYTDTVSYGDGDFLTEDTLWDFKVSKKPVNKDWTMQIMMYWRMGLRTGEPEFKTIEYLGIFNPRKNEVNRIAVKDIPADVIDIVDYDVIGYKRPRNRKRKREVPLSMQWDKSWERILRNWAATHRK